jgi:predicted amidohydrolase
MSIQYKIGLTESEKNFFSLPDKINNKVFNYQNKKIAILICFEAQQAPFKFFKEGEVDLILWPGYIHSGEDKSWGDCENQVFTNMKSWKVPLVQANFSHNDETIKSPSGPDGHSIILQKDNKLFKRGKFKEDDFLSVNLESLK